MSLAVKDVIQMALTQLEANGISEAKLDAELIFRHIMNVDKMGYFKLWGTILDDDMCDRYLDLISVRAGGKPLQYITGEQDFMGFTFRVNPEVLIPRPDTETLVTEAVSIIGRMKKKNRSALDLGCGCGCIGISLSKLCSETKVTVSDISKAAIETAKQNAMILNARVSFVAGNWFAPFNKRFGREKFDLIVSNPPYIPTGVIPALQTEIKDHEPIIALDGGADGLVHYRKIIPEAHAHLNKGGAIAFEIGSDQLIDVVKIADECDKYSDFRVIKDLAGNDRVVVLEI